MKRACFTLVELLVVVAMITLLLAISLSVLRGIRRRARALACITHIRQMTLDLIMYETDNETFPYGFLDQFNPAPPGGFVGDPTKDRQAWWWFHFMEGYADTKKKMLRCPTRPDPTGDGNTKLLRIPYSATSPRSLLFAQ